MRHDKPLVGPGPSRRRWLWGGAAALAVASGGAVLWARHPSLGAPRPASTAPAATPSSPAAPSIPYYPATLVKGESVFAQIDALNAKYMAWADRQIAAQVPGIPATGPDAGTLTPAVMNSAAVLQRWPGPKVPLSLAGIPIPADTPANGSIVGLTPQFLQRMLPSAAHGLPDLTAADLRGAFTVAAKYIVAGSSNNPVSALRYMDPYAWGTGADVAALANRGSVPVTQGFTAPADEGGMLPLRQVEYRIWAAITPQTTYDTSCPPTTRPQGYVRVSCLDVRNLQVDIIGTGMVDGKLEIGRFVGTFPHTAVVLLEDHTIRRWYVLGGKDGSGSNIPVQVYWIAK